MSAIMTETFNTMLFILNSYLWAMGISGVFLLAIVLIPHREDAHDLLDRIYDAGNNLLDWLGNTTHSLIQGTKETAALVILPFVFIAEAMWDLVKITAKGLAVAAVVLAVVMVTAVILAGAAISFWAALPLVLGYVAILKTISGAKAVKAKVAQMIENHKAAVAEKAEKAEAEAKAEFRAKAEAAGFVHVDDVSALIAKHVKAHETEKHEQDLNLKVEALTVGLHRAVARQAKAEASKVVEIVEHAQAVVLKAVTEMTIQEMREELGCGKRFNTVQLRAKVRAARANS